MNVAPIAELNTYSSGSSVSVVGKVLYNSAPEPLYSQQIVKARLRDNTGVIQYSLIGNAIKKCNFGVNDVLLLQNVTLKIFGALHVLMGSTGIRIVKPSDRDYSCFLSTATTPCAEITPDRKNPAKNAAGYQSRARESLRSRE